MKKGLLILLVILIGAFIVRLYKFNAPVADWHSWRQTDTSAVSRNFVKFGYDVLAPRFDDLSNGVSLIDNPYGYRFVEFPFYNILQAGFFEAFGRLTIEEWGRLITIFSSLGATVFLYLLVRKHISARAGLLAAFFFSFVPYNIYYGRVILPDTSMVAAFLAGLYFFDNFLDAKGIFKKFIYYFLAIFLVSISLLIKPFVVFFFLPFLYLIFMKYGIAGFKKPEIWIFFISSIAPFLLWRMWMQNFPEGIPRNDWLYNGNSIRFRPAFYWWLFAERISRIILGYWGLPFVVLGILLKTGNREKLLFFTFIVSSLIYVHVFATGNVQHDYYQILIIPTLAIFFAKGVDFLLGSKEIFNRFVSYLTITVGTLFMVAFGWFGVRDYYSIQHPNLIVAGLAVDRLTPKDAKIIAPYGGDATFLYHTNRKGWPVFDRTFKDFKMGGASYIAFADPTQDELNLEKLFKPVRITSTYAIFDLNQPTAEGLKEQKKD